MSEELYKSQNLYETIITLERTICCGRCPVYKLTIFGNGAVMYNGLEFVAITGRHMANITEDKIQRLIGAFKKADFFSLNNSYVEFMRIEDPFAITSLTINGKKKRVRHYHGDNSAPHQLRILEDEIDEIVGTDQWVHAQNKRSSQIK
ncbi:MAG TPA: DUF6438 domain-containing protein [Candidatus Acidoferrum sp.]|nr:DUF6438 domain-containing protein [Candidatus Acidoferrum sp.]